MTDKESSEADLTGRGWTFADERCPYPGGCDLPVRTHTHYIESPGAPVVVVFYEDEKHRYGDKC